MLMCDCLEVMFPPAMGYTMPAGTCMISGFMASQPVLSHTTSHLKKVFWPNIFVGGKI